jgi:hypothetical protein
MPAYSFLIDVDINSFRNDGTYVLHIRWYISYDGVTVRSVVQFFSVPTEDGLESVDRVSVYVNEGSNYVFLVRTHPS